MLWNGGHSHRMILGLGLVCSSSLPPLLLFKLVVFVIARKDQELIRSIKCTGSIRIRLSIWGFSMPFWTLWRLCRCWRDLRRSMVRLLPLLCLLDVSSSSFLLHFFRAQWWGWMLHLMQVYLWHCYANSVSNCSSFHISGCSLYYYWEIHSTGQYTCGWCKVRI